MSRSAARLSAARASPESYGTAIWNVATSPPGLYSGCGSDSANSCGCAAAAASTWPAALVTAARSSGVPSSVQTTTSCALPSTGNAATIRSYVATSGIERGRSCGPVKRSTIPSAGSAIATRSPAPRTNDSLGRPSTTRSTAGQKRARPSLRCSRWMNGTRGRSTDRPSLTRSAGSTVTEPSIATATTSTVPTPSDTNVGSPERNNPDIAMITARPDTTIARPEVAAAISTAWSDVRPLARSSRSRRR